MRAAAISERRDSSDAAPARLSMSVLGTLKVARDGVPLTASELRRPRVRELLLYLVAHTEAPREELASALWPESGNAAGCLRTYLSHLLRVLEPERREGEDSLFVRDEHRVLRLAGDRVDVDAWRFDQLVDEAAARDTAGDATAAREAYRRAFALCRGEYLADARYTEWATPHREAFRARYVSAATRAGELLLVEGAATEAAQLAMRAISVEPWSEAAYRLLAGAHLAAGNRAAAWRALAQCQAMLAGLGARPEPETIALIDRSECGALA
jgi:LuxR family maltose regulon positive regulatory protein